MSNDYCRLYTEDNFSEIERDEGVAMIRFSAEWCKPCVDSEPFFDAVVTQRQASVKFGKVDTLQAPVLTAKYGIWAVPNIIIFKNGQEVKRLRGPQSTAMLLDALAPYLSP